MKLTVVLLFVACVVATSQANEFAAACEGYDAEVKCNTGVIRVLDVLYGRTQEHICGRNRGNQNCIAATGMQVVRDRCEGNTVCNIKADNALFGDPCSGTDKYLQVFYDCV